MTDREGGETMDEPNLKDMPQARWFLSGAVVLIATVASMSCATVDRPRYVTPASLARAGGTLISLDPLGPIDQCFRICQVVSNNWKQARCPLIPNTAEEGFCQGTFSPISAAGGQSSIRMSVQYVSGDRRLTQYWFGRVPNASELVVQIGQIKLDPATVLFQDGFESGNSSAWALTKR